MKETREIRGGKENPVAVEFSRGKPSAKESLRESKESSGVDGLSGRAAEEAG